MATQSERIISAFKPTIDSYEAYLAAITIAIESTSRTDIEYYATRNITESLGNATADYFSGGNLSGRHTTPYHSKNVQQSWWWNREQVRIHCDIYPPRTGVMAECVNALSLSQWCLHPSTDPSTPEAVSYTPNPDFGQRDKQLKMGSLGKFLRKYAPLLTDDHIQAIEAAHRAELDPTLLIATTKEDIEAVYTDRDYVESCMGYKSSRWSISDTVHPTHVYAGNGNGVAYMRNGTGAISARALVFTDHTTGKLHYLRVYGDRALETRLKRAGYTLKNTVGAKFTVVRDGEVLIMPYVDGVGGSQGESDGTYGYIDKNDPTVMQMISYARYTKLITAGVKVLQFKNHSSVTYNMEPQDLSTLTFVCPLSGITVDRTKDSFTTIWLNGKEQRVLETKYVGNRFDGWACTFIDGQRQGISYDAKAQPPLFYSSRFGHMLDNETNRLKCGQVKLSPFYYPGETGWSDANDTVKVLEAYIMRKDAVRVIEADSTHKFMFSDRKTLKVLREGGYLPMGTGDRIRRFMHKDNPSIVTLKDGKRLSKEYYDLAKLYDGTFVLSKDAHAMSIGGYSVMVHKNWTPEKVIDPVSVFGGAGHWAGRSAEFIANDLGLSLASCKNRAVQALRHTVGSHGAPCFLDAGRLYRTYSRIYNCDSWPLMSEFAEQVKAYAADEEKFATFTKDNGYGSDWMIRQWLANYEYFKAAVERVQAHYASLEEAEALPF